jgi:hypothetical protein
MEENATSAPGSPTPVGLHDWYYWWSCCDYLLRELTESPSRRLWAGPLACRTGAKSDTRWGWLRIHRRAP